MLKQLMKLLPFCLGIDMKLVGVPYRNSQGFGPRLYSGVTEDDVSINIHQETPGIDANIPMISADQVKFTSARLSSFTLTFSTFTDTTFADLDASADPSTVHGQNLEPSQTQANHLDLCILDVINPTAQRSGFLDHQEVQYSDLEGTLVSFQPRAIVKEAQANNQPVWYHSTHDHQVSVDLEMGHDGRTPLSLSLLAEASETIIDDDQFTYPPLPPLLTVAPVTVIDDEQYKHEGQTPPSPLYLAEANETFIYDEHYKEHYKHDLQTHPPSPLTIAASGTINDDGQTTSSPSQLSEAFEKFIDDEQYTRHFRHSGVTQAIVRQNSSSAGILTCCRAIKG
jgi:hypothetical protein